MALAAAVAAVALAAIVDALRSGERATPRRAEIASRLREAGVRGTLVVETVDCRVVAVELRTLAVAPVRTTRFCGAPLGEAAQPACRLGARDTLAGSVASIWRLGASCVRWVSQGLRQRLRARCDAVESGPVIRLSPSRLGALARCGHGSAVGVFRGRTLAWSAVFPERAIGELRASLNGRYVAVAGDGGITAFAADGRSFVLPAGLAKGHAIAWSPTERWTAIADRAAVYVFRTGAPRRPVHRIPLAVADLAWR